MGNLEWFLITFSHTALLYKLSKALIIKFISKKKRSSQVQKAYFFLNSFETSNALKKGFALFKQTPYIFSEQTI